ncbi:MAG: hypothetical protein HEQ22_03850 [Sphingopyxis sp.]|uniref:hypothetical protein n=1 Tax=Sphingopyxis sp. TaxID=1908224 RepID=UPI003D81242E
MNSELRRVYIKIRKWVDHGIGDTASRMMGVMLVPAIVPIAMIAPFVGGNTPHERIVRLAPLLTWAIVWTMFSIWRGLRMMKAQSAKNARHYDRIGKFELPTEYADSESALKAKRRRKR